MFTYRGPMWDWRFAFLLACRRHHGKRATRIGYGAEEYAESCWRAAGLP